MAATAREIKGWVEEAKVNGNAFCVILCDTYDHDDYPSPCKTAEDCRKLLAKPGEMQRIMEVYDLSMDIDAQMREHRAWHPPAPEVANG